MNAVIIISSLVVLVYAAPQYGYDDSKAVSYQIFGLSGGNEDNEEYGQSEYKGNEYDYAEKKYEDSIGFTGSDFRTPVDVHHEKEIHIKANPEYHFAYKVADSKHKDYKNQQESRDGYKVKGSYSLLEPDHKTIRVVDYVSDKKLGFVAKVSYKQAHY